MRIKKEEESRSAGLIEEMLRQEKSFGVNFVYIF